MGHERTHYLATIVEHATEWVPQEVAAELLAEVWRLRGLIDRLAARVAAQAELLARRAEREKP